MVFTMGIKIASPNTHTHRTVMKIKWTEIGKVLRTEAGTY